MLLPARAFVILALFVGGASGAPAQTPGLKNESKSSITGKVTIKGKPAAGIVVGMHFERADNSSPTYKAITNQDGVYRITNILNGIYIVAPVAPAMVNTDENSPDGQIVVITGGDSTQGIDFNLAPGGVITGKVTDADGHPLIEISVSARTAEVPNQQRGYQMFSAQTDDRGIYRIFGIHAGRYKVVVNDGRRWSRNGPAVMEATYYPDVQDANKATIVEVNEGGVAGDIDIRLAPPVPGFTISGRVIDESGNPVPNFGINLAKIILNGNSTNREGTGVNPVSDSLGKFRATNVQPGKYEVSIYGRQDSDLWSEAPVRFDVLDSDVSDLVIKTVRGAQVSGVVIFEGGKKPAVDATSHLAVMLYRQNDSGSGFDWGGGTGVKADGSFVINAVKPGTLTFKVGGWERDNGFSLVRIERDGVVQPNGIQIEGAQHVTGLRLFVTYTNGDIIGVVKISNGTLPPGARIAVQLTRAEEPNVAVGAGEVDARGHFLIEGLAAGNYELTVVVFLVNPGRSPTARQAVTVTDGAVTDVSVTLDLTPNP